MTASTITVQITGTSDDVLALFDRPTREEIMADFTRLGNALSALSGQVQQVIAIVQDLRTSQQSDAVDQTAADSAASTVEAMVTGLQSVTSPST